MEALLALNVGLSLAGALVFGLVAVTIRRRPVSPEFVLPRNAFLAWWWTLSFLSVVGAGMTLAGSQGFGDLAFYLTLTFSLLFLLCVAFWGLLYYLVFLYLNTRRAAMMLGAGYFLLFLWLVYILLAREPYGIRSSEWGVEILYTYPPGPSATIAGLLFLVPIIAAAAGYLALAFKVKEFYLRRRIIIVGTSIILWFLSSVPGSANPELGTDPTWRLVTRFIGLLAALAIYFAFAHLNPPEEGVRPTEVHH